MVRRVFTLGTGVVGLALVAVLVIGMAGAVSAFAAPKHKPVVTAVGPTTGLNTGGTTVTITGANFRLNGKNAVKQVTFGGKAATHVHVKSATSVRVKCPAGMGRVNVRVTTKAGTSKRVSADRFTYVGPATQIALSAGDGQTASAGAAVKILPSVIVKDAKGRPVPKVSVTFAVATGGGTVTGASAKTNTAGIATVGSWKLGTTAGANSLTATSTGLTGSPVSFNAAGDAGILLVQQNGTPVRAYSLDELKALTPFVGWAGLFKNPAIGPDAVTGVRVTDIVKDALGTALTSTQSVDVVNLAPPKLPYDGGKGPMTYEQLVNLKDFLYYDATTRVQNLSPTGPMAAVLIYSDPDQKVMPAASGPLRFVVADATGENLVFAPTSLSVSTVNLLNVITP